VGHHGFEKEVPVGHWHGKPPPARRGRGCETIELPERFEEIDLPFVYILHCRDGSFYTGAAKDLAARLRQHGAGRASRYTRARRPLKLVWSRRVRTWSAALREEHRIKQLSRREKEMLVAGGRDVVA